MRVSMNRTTEHRKPYVLPLLMTYVIVVLLAFGSSILMTPKSYYFSRPARGWSLSRGDEHYENVDLGDFNLGHTYRGEVITISTNLPATDIPIPNFTFLSRLSAVDVWLDGQKIDSYGWFYYETRGFVPKKLHFINVGNGSVPHTIKISFTVAEDDAFRHIDIPYYGAKIEIVLDFLQTHRLPFFVGGFLIMYAVVLLPLGSFLVLFHDKDFTLFATAGISLLFGSYTYASHDIFCVISDKDLFFSLLEYISLYMLPVALSTLIYSTHSYIATRVQRIFLFINTLLPINFVLMRISGSTKVNTMVNLTQLVALIEIAVMLPLLITGMRRENKEKAESDTYTGISPSSYLLLGFIILIICALLEIAKYTITKYHFRSDNPILNVSFLTLGALLFVICLFVFYFFNGVEHINSKYIKSHLEGLAYTDALTGLMNRAKCTQYAATLSGPYAVVRLDLDRLKKVNDTYGHLEGDKMIRAFSDLVQKAFDKASLIGRTGGDEFVVFFDEPNAQFCEGGIRALEQYMNEFNQGKELFTLSASMGYALSTEEPGGTFDDVFYLADTRMYEMKEKHHA